MTAYIHHKQLGRVLVTQRSNSVRFTARWRNGEVALSIPVGTTRGTLDRTLDKMAPRLLAIRPPKEQKFADGKVIEAEGLTINISVDAALAPSRMSRKLLHDKASGSFTLTIRLAPDIKLDDPFYEKQISTFIAEMLTPVATHIILPLAKQHARRLGLNPSGWVIGRGMRILGTCSIRRIVTLSRAIVLLPPDMRDYVICHELAHLTEMNHSPRFHALLERYLPGAAEISQRLRKHNWPISR